MSITEKTETYYRADQAYRLAHSRALLESKHLARDLREAQAALDCEEELQARLDALIAYESSKDGLMDGFFTAQSEYMGRWLRKP